MLERALVITAIFIALENLLYTKVARLDKFLSKHGMVWYVSEQINRTEKLGDN